MNLTWGAITALVLAALVGILAQWSGSAPAAVLWGARLVGVAGGLGFELFVTRTVRLGARWRGAARRRGGRAVGRARAVGRDKQRKRDGE
jgi:hypothetical protein